jgi:hypothetical protein
MPEEEEKGRVWIGARISVREMYFVDSFDFRLHIFKNLYMAYSNEPVPQARRTSVLHL